MYGIAIKNSKKFKYVCISKNGKCDNFNDQDFVFLNSIFSGKEEVITTGVYRLPLDFDESLFSSFQKNESKAKNVLDYCKESGMLKNF